VVHDAHPLRTRLVLPREKAAAPVGSHADHVEEGGGDEAPDHSRGLFAAGQVDALVHEGAHRLEGAGLAAQVLEVGVGEVHAAPVEDAGDGHETLRATSCPARLVRK
jgi:succinate dehydrogenase/fumarate reductase flavoprotein subunit